jgi:hypothetical protein
MIPILMPARQNSGEIQSRIQQYPVNLEGHAAWNAQRGQFLDVDGKGRGVRGIKRRSAILSRSLNKRPTKTLGFNAPAEKLAAMVQ